MIARSWFRVYLRGMAATALLRFSIILALLFAPLGMLGNHAAMAMPGGIDSMADHMAGAAPGHCADVDGDRQGPASPRIDCMIACSSLPAAEFQVEAHPMIAALIEPAPFTSSLHGVHPESDPPPPRTA